MDMVYRDSFRPEEMRKKSGIGKRIPYAGMILRKSQIFLKYYSNITQIFSIKLFLIGNDFYGDFGTTIFSIGQLHPAAQLLSKQVTDI